jgi:hypothetical protein
MLKRRRVFISLSVIFALLGMLPTKIAANDSKARFLVTLPMVFERNQGQAPAKYQFLARRKGAEMLFLADGLDVVTNKSQSNLSGVRIRWVTINPDIFPSGEEVLPGQSNYFRGSDSSKWIKDVPHYGQVRYREIYPGIDLIFHGYAETVEHDFLVQPGAEPSRIVFSINRPFQINRVGDLVIGRAGMVLQRPVAYQLVGETRTNIDVRYLRERNGHVKLKLGPYNHAQRLIIDPVFTFSTYLAGTGDDQISAVTTDAIGDIYVTGNTNSVDFPLVNAEQSVCSSCTDFLKDPDVYVSKLDPTGHTLLFSTYIGGSLSDLGQAIVTDNAGDILVAGLSLSSDFPHAGAIQSASCQINQKCFFLLSLAQSGSTLNYSGLVGGGDGNTTNGFFGEPYISPNDVILTVDATRNAYVGGVTNDRNFTLTPGTIGSALPGYPYDSAFVMKIGPTGNLLYSTIIPGTAPNSGSTLYANDFPPAAILADAEGQVTLAGSAAVGLPTTPGVLQTTFPANNTASGSQIAGYVLQLNSTATGLNYATYIPGTDYVGGAVVDPSGDVYLTGYTSESNLPVSANAYQKSIIQGPTCACQGGYILKLAGNGTSVIAATYLGGTPIAQKLGTLFDSIALDSNSNVFVGGNTFSADFPLVDPFVSPLQFFDFADGLVVAGLNQDLSRLIFGSFLSSFLSTLGQNEGAQFSGLTVDSQSNLIVIGDTTSTNFPTTKNSFRTSIPPQQNPPTHGFISKLNLAVPAPSVCFSPAAINFGTGSIVNLNITNCGNATLQIASVTSSSSSVVPAQSCASIHSQNALIHSNPVISLTGLPLLTGLAWSVACGIFWRRGKTSFLVGLLAVLLLASPFVGCGGGGAGGSSQGGGGLAIPPGSTCVLPVTVTGTTFVSGALTFMVNAAIPEQTVPFGGQ